MRPHPNAPFRPTLARPAFVPKIQFPTKLAPRLSDIGHKVEEALALVRPALKAGKSPDLGFGEKMGLRAALWALNKVLKGAGNEDDVRDLVQAAAGVVGFAKRRFATGSSTREVLEEADALLDKAHAELGEAKG